MKGRQEGLKSGQVIIRGAISDQRAGGDQEDAERASFAAQCSRWICSIRFFWLSRAASATWLSLVRGTLQQVACPLSAWPPPISATLGRPWARRAGVLACTMVRRIGASMGKDDSGSADAPQRHLVMPPGARQSLGCGPCINLAWITSACLHSGRRGHDSFDPRSEILRSGLVHSSSVWELPPQRNLLFAG
jgi:hypothetical protein